MKSEVLTLCFVKLYVKRKKKLLKNDKLGLLRSEFASSSEKNPLQPIFFELESPNLAGGKCLHFALYYRSDKRVSRR